MDLDSLKRAFWEGERVCSRRVSEFAPMDETCISQNDKADSIIRYSLINGVVSYSQIRGSTRRRLWDRECGSPKTGDFSQVERETRA